MCAHIEWTMWNAYQRSSTLLDIQHLLTSYYFVQLVWAPLTPNYPHYYFYDITKWPTAISKVGYYTSLEVLSGMHIWMKVQDDASTIKLLSTPLIIPHPPGLFHPHYSDRTVQCFWWATCGVPRKACECGWRNCNCSFRNSALSEAVEWLAASPSVTTKSTTFTR